MTRCSRLILSSLSRLWKQPLLPGILIYFNGKWYWPFQVWALDTLIPIAMLLLPDRAKKQMFPQTHIQICSLPSDTMCHGTISWLSKNPSLPWSACDTTACDTLPWGCPPHHLVFDPCFGPLWLLALHPPPRTPLLTRLHLMALGLKSLGRGRRRAHPLLWWKILVLLTILCILGALVSDPLNKQYRLGLPAFPQAFVSVW